MEIINKENFNTQVENYKRTDFYLCKSTAYQNGFKDAISLAWEIVLDHASQQAVQADADMRCRFVKCPFADKCTTACDWSQSNRTA